jgi:hypothetical protein
MTRAIFTSLFSIACLLLLAVPNAASACTGLTLLGGNPPAIAYNPFSGSPATQTFTVQVTNICGPGVQPGQRSAQIWFVDDIPPAPYNRRLGGALYDITFASSSVLSDAGNPAPPKLTVVYAANQGGAQTNQQRTFTISLPASQSATTAQRQISMKWSYENENGLVVEQSVPINLATSVVSGVNISIAGTGATAGVVDFGTFSGQAETRGLMLRVGATQAYRVRLETVQGGILRRTTQCGVAATTPAAPKEAIAYTATLGGSSLGELAPFVSPTGTVREGVLHDDLPLAISVPAFDLASRRAGQFCDVLRLRVEMF